ncbi:MAG TPA: hypothetical protein VKU92_11125 [Acidimicrobiales bacterium]|nr:hypothetical protein [Acidimicrobiales bacterium]
MESLFGRYEAATLLAVERANGGEAAPLEQVIAAFEQLFGALATAATMAESTSLLVDAGLVEWGVGGLGLTVEGRRAIRRSGAHFDPELPEKVEARLSLIEEEDLAPEGELASPSEDDFIEALRALGRGGFEVAPPAEEGPTLSPSRMAGHLTLAPRLLSGLPGGFGIKVEVPGMPEPRPAPPRPEAAPATPPSPPSVRPAEPAPAGEDGGAPEV